MAFVVVALVFWMVSISQKLVIPTKNASLSVTFLASGDYLIGKDTTNYDNFASVLSRQIQQLKQKSANVELRLILPKNKNTGQVADIVQITNAFEGITLKMSIQ